MSIAQQEAAYATNATPEKFWAKWQEKFNTDEEEQQYKSSLQVLKNQPLTPEQKSKLFSDRFKYVRQYFDDLGNEHILLTIQDEYLYGLCRPERLTDIIFNFILFDNGEKKIARYPQFFAIKKSMQRIIHIEGGKRKGGVIWHTQGSGKSLTMVIKIGRT
jgi:type I restriction enzyme R subunit